MGVMGTAELAAEVRGDKHPEDQVRELENPRLHEEYTFPIKWKNARGRSFEGSFTNRTLNAFQKTQVGVMCAKLCQGLPFDSLPVDSQILIRKMAHLEISLTGKRPDWAEDLGQIKDEELIDEIYAEVLEHERIFRGYRTDSEVGAAQDADGRGDNPTVVPE